MVYYSFQVWSISKYFSSPSLTVTHFHFIPLVPSCLGDKEPFILCFSDGIQRLGWGQIKGSWPYLSNQVLSLCPYSSKGPARLQCRCLISHHAHQTPQVLPSHSFPVPSWAEHSVALELCSVLGVDLLEMEHARLSEMFFQGLGAVPYLLHPGSFSWQARCCRAELPREHGVTRVGLGSWQSQQQRTGLRFCSPFLFKTCKRGLRSASRGSERSCFSDSF